MEIAMRVLSGVLCMAMAYGIYLMMSATEVSSIDLILLVSIAFCMIMFVGQAIGVDRCIRFLRVKHDDPAVLRRGPLSRVEEIRKYESSNGQDVTAIRSAAHAGDARAQFDLGLISSQGAGVLQCDVEAAKWYRKAAEQGFAKAQYNLGLMYHNGRGVPQIDVEAIRWFRQAADQGHARSQNNLGVMYDNGWGVEQDYIEAARLYRAAAESGVADAQNNLGCMYLAGEGVSQDEREAEHWFRLAASQGHPDAIKNLGAGSAEHFHLAS